MFAEGERTETDGAGRDGPRASTAHQIGQKLDDLSIADFDDRIALLRDEIARLERAKVSKQAALADAGSIFRMA